MSLWCSEVLGTYKCLCGGGKLKQKWTWEEVESLHRKRGMRNERVGRKSQQWPTKWVYFLLHTLRVGTVMITVVKGTPTYNSSSAFSSASALLNRVVMGSSCFPNLRLFQCVGFVSMCGGQKMAAPRTPHIKVEKKECGKRALPAEQSLT